VLGQIQGTYNINNGNILTNIISSKYVNQASKGFVN